MYRIIIGILFLVSSLATFAVEGMWLPILLEKYNIEEMQAEGFKLTAQDIYDINKASLKDAVVGLVDLNSPFHHFCTGEIISPDGLVLTNHHCGYDEIQKHSSVENDLLKDGFWAMSREEELTNEGLGICILKRMEDVTEKVLDSTTNVLNPLVRDSIILANIKEIEIKAVEGTHYLAKVKSFYSGNEYYLSVYEIFRDIRLVSAPPSAIGKFGGDTDNWMWPRHTGDFSMFRIYADSSNNPADFSNKNIPYQPKKHLEINTSGIKKGDFTMVMGYPGTTEEYLPSFAIDLRMNTTNPIRINIRGKALDIMKADMNKSQEVRIKYSAKVASMANGYKKWIGENKGLKRLNAIEKKQTQEKLFVKWLNENDERKKKYGFVMGKYSQFYSEINTYNKVYTYMSETILSAEIIELAKDVSSLIDLKKDISEEELAEEISKIKKRTKEFYNDYNKPTDKKLFVELLSIYYTEVPKEYHLPLFQSIDKKYKGDFKSYFADLFEKSILSDENKMNKFLNNYSTKKSKALNNDAAIRIFDEGINIYYSKVRPYLLSLREDIKSVHKIYVKGLLEFESDKRFFPDANSTFRIAYGKINNYEPRDAVEYHYATTLHGIIEKDNPEIFDYDVPQRLRDLYNNKDYGNYANTDGTMPVCFTASNHTTGGNSGSPVLNAQGQLIGINFDRNWEGTMSDLMYDPEMCRNIAVDIRYILFIIDKYAGATHLINELSIVRNEVDKNSYIEATPEKTKDTL